MAEVPQVGPEAASLSLDTSAPSSRRRKKWVVRPRFRACGSLVSSRWSPGKGIVRPISPPQLGVRALSSSLEGPKS